MDRVRRERDRFAGFVVRDTEAIPGSQRLRGRARFVGPSTLEVDAIDAPGDVTRVEAGAVVVATGSTQVIPPPFDAIRESVMVNDDVFEWEDLPESLAVIGTGIIGLELGQALARLGVRVALFNPGQSLGPFSDPEVQRVARDVLAEELELHLGAEMLEARAGGSGVTLRWRLGAREEERTFQRVLVAAGRKPRLAGLDLAKAGVPLDERGLPPWDPDTAQGHLPLLHEAADEGRIAGANAARYPEVTVHQRRAGLGIAFTDPQMAIVGTPHRDLDPDAAEIGEVSYADQGRARVAGRNKGLVRLYANRRGCHLIGAEMFGPRVEHMAHLLAWVVQEGMTVQHILRMPFYHPVFEEGLRTGLRELAAKLRVTDDCRCEDLADAPGA
jgi:dihydrolipoamide dehydrogenase